MDQLLTLDEVAAVTQIPRRTLEDLRYKGLGPPAVKIGRAVRFRPADVERWIEARISGTRAS